MSGIVLSAVELMSSNVRDFDGKGDGKTAITETPIQIEDLSGNDDDDDTKTVHTESIPSTISPENGNNLDCPTTNRQRSPTSNSIGSNNMSIVTLDENDNDSSLMDSDSDCDEVINYNNNNDYRNPSGIVLVNKNLDPPTFCQSSIVCTNNDVKPNIGSIAVQNSHDITFGNKTFYQGPVTIKQFVYDKNKWKEAEQAENDNLGYVNSSTDNLSRKEKGKSPKKYFLCNPNSTHILFIHFIV